MIEGISLFLSGKNFMPQSFIERIKEYKDCDIVSYHNIGDKVVRKLIAEEGECQIIKKDDIGLPGKIKQYESWYIKFIKDNIELISKSNIDEVQIWIDLYMTKGSHGYEVFNKEQLAFLGKMNVSIPVTIHVMTKKEIIQFAKDNKIQYQNLDDLF